MDDWPTSCRFPPWIEDRNGVLFNQAFQLSKFAGRQLPNGAGSTAPFGFLHEQPYGAGRRK
jgi:hypothetical protein